MQSELENSFRKWTKNALKNFFFYFYDHFFDSTALKTLLLPGSRLTYVCAMLRRIFLAMDEMSTICRSKVMPKFVTKKFVSSSHF